MRVSYQDKPFINKELKTLNRQKQRANIKWGKCQKYLDVKKEFDKKYKAAAARYIRTKVEDLKEAEPGKAYNILKILGSQPGCTEDLTFSLPGHKEQNLSDEECANRIAEHFAKISAEFPPLNPTLLPDRVKVKLNDGSTAPTITEHDCYAKMRAAKKPKSVIPGDLPTAIVKQFLVELANPVAALCNNIAQNASWPEHFKVEYITPVAKIPSPLTEDDLRPIAMTAFFSKIMEQFIVSWLLEVLGDKMDFRQYGGTKGNSISHYLIEFLNFILHQQENESTAVLACLVDFSKAFNRQDHSILVTKLNDMGVPGWLLRLVVAFLQNRKIKVKYKGKYSKLFSLPGGGPQGSLLGLFLFLILINDAGFSEQENNVGDMITRKKRIAELNVIHMKYVDDLAVAEAVNMNTQLKNIPLQSRPQPDTFRARTGHKLNNEESHVFKQLIEIQNYAESNKMKLNIQKTKLMLFNPCKTKDFMPEIRVNQNRVELIEQTKLLGVILSSDLSWAANTEYIVKRCLNKTWMLRRLKRLGASQDDLLEVYIKQVRSLAEYGVPVWNSSLTGEDIVSLERIQKTALHIILGDAYKSYNSGLKNTGLEKLSDRRKKICLKFAKRALKHSKFSRWFKLNTKTDSRLKQPKFCPPVYRTERFKKSPISYLTSLLNSN